MPAVASLIMVAAASIGTSVAMQKRAEDQVEDAADGVLDQRIEDLRADTDAARANGYTRGMRGIL